MRLCFERPDVVVVVVDVDVVADVAVVTVVDVDVIVADVHVVGVDVDVFCCC